MSDYETAERKRNIIVGVFVIGAIIALFWLVFYWFRDLPGAITKLGSFQVFVQFPTAKGVQKDTDVYFCGYPIGNVTDVMAPEIRRNLNTGQEYHQTVVVLSLGKKYVNIPSNVEIKLMSRGLGSSYIELAGDPNLPPVAQDPNRPETKFLVQDMLLQGSSGMTSEFFPEESQKKFEELVETITVLTKNLNEVVGDPNTKEDFKSILANISNASRQATKMFEEVQKLSAAGTTLLKNADAKVDKFVTAMVTTSEELSKTLAGMRAILEKVNSGKGTAGKLVNDPELYENLVESTEEMRELLKELKSFMTEANKKGSLPINTKIF